MTASELAQKLLDFYGGDAKKWTKGTYARDHEDQSVEHDSPRAVCWCAVGALRVITGDRLSAHQARAVLPDLVTRNDGAETFRDFENYLKEFSQ